MATAVADTESSGASPADPKLEAIEPSPDERLCDWLECEAAPPELHFVLERLLGTDLPAGIDALGALADMINKGEFSINDVQGEIDQVREDREREIALGEEQYEVTYGLLGPSYYHQVREEQEREWWAEFESARASRIATPRRPYADWFPFLVCRDARPWRVYRVRRTSVV